MEYTKVIAYADILEVYQYEKRPVNLGRKTKRAHGNLVLPTVLPNGEVVEGPDKPPQIRSKESIRRAELDFKRLVRANLAVGESPVFASLTYAENMQDYRRARKDFASFTRALRDTFGHAVRFIAITERQRRGAIHYHALLWGLPAEVVRTERFTRLVANLWQQGFVDLKQTDGHPAIAGYMCKYMSKQFGSVEFAGMKAYVGSHNLVRPTIDKDAILAVYFSTHKAYRCLQDKEYMTPWLGRGRYRLLDQVELPYESESYARG